MEITPQELKAKLDSKADLDLVDVREQEEYEICHIEGASLIPMSELESRLSELNQDRSIVLYCHHAPRSASAAEWLEAQGFKQVKSLQGGIDAWAEQIDSTMERY